MAGAGGSASATGGSFGTGGSVDAASGGSFSGVQAIFDARCVICHDANKRGIPTNPTLPLTSDKSYDALVGKSGQEPCGGMLVVAGNPMQSYLYQKITNDQPCSGVRMPRPYEIGPAVNLSDVDIATVRDWIAAGAPR
jgi:hypothetical protein